MEMVVSPDVDADVRRLTNGLFGVQADDRGVYLVHFPTDERVCVVRLANDGPSADGDERGVAKALLSERERQVFEMIGNGMGMDEIASQLHISVKTVETFRSRIKKKLNITNRSRLIALAVEYAIERRRTNAAPAGNGRPA